MAWTRIDDGLPEHPKLYAAADLVPKSGYARVLAMIIGGLCYANRNLTDGFLPSKIVQNFDEVNTNEVISALCSAHIWAQCEGGYRIHDYHHYQLTAQEVKEKRAKDRARKIQPESTRNPQGGPNGIQTESDRIPERSRARVPSPPLPSPPNPVTKNNKLECVPVSLPPAEPAHTHTNGNGNGFDEKWETFKTEYPSSRRSGGFLCQQLFLTACGKVGFEKLISALRAHKTSSDWKKGMIPGMQKFFEKELWIQEPESASIASLHGSDAIEAATSAFLKANRT